jgi:hypothetical protein
MHRILTVAGLALALAVQPAAAQMVTITPQQIGEIFCIASLGNDMAPVEALLTPALRTAIADAMARDAEWATANPGEKPPLGDGIPWQAYPDYAPECLVLEVEIAGSAASVEVSHRYPDDPLADFTDTLHLVQQAEPGRSSPVWRIDNVAFVIGDDLRIALDSAFSPISE